MSKRVDFVIAGTQKGGTTSLQDYLKNHPEICMARGEGHFFDRDKHFRRKPVDYSDYHRLFKSCPDERLWGEKTPTYMYWYPAPRRIWMYNPAMKWIVLLRNPIDRAYSHWNMAQRRGMEDETGFLDAVYHERRRARESLPRQHKRLSFVDRGFYSDQLRRIWFFFPREQTLILKSEEFRVSRHTALDKVCRFLGAEPFPRDYPVEESVSKYEPMGEDARALLAGVFEHEIHEVERLLGWDCSDWLS